MVVRSVKLRCSKKNGERLLEIFKEYDLVSLELPSVMLNQVENFIAGKRKNVATFEILRENLIEVACTKDAAKMLLQMLKETKIDTVVFPNLPKENVADFISGTRDNLLQLDIILNDNK